jgi:APA family basic amino acid/polyamine antiporter
MTNLKTSRNQWPLGPDTASKAAQPSSLELRPRLSLFDTSMVVAGSMIGSGIFIVSADIVRRVHSPAALLAVWVVSGVMTVSGALAYGELAAMMPQAGGQYVYLRQAYGSLCAFLYGWTLFLVIQTGTIAAVSVAFARFAAVFWPGLGGRLPLLVGFGVTGQQALAVAVIFVLTAANLRGIDVGRGLQNAFTAVKLLSLALIIGVGLVAANPAAVAANFSAGGFFGAGGLSFDLLTGFGAAMVGGLFSADAWAAATFAAAELHTPTRDLPRALVRGTLTVVVLYLLANAAYLAELPAHGAAGGPSLAARGIAYASEDRVTAAAMAVAWGPTGAALAALIVMVSTFGCANGLILTGARAVYAMAKDGLFLAPAARLNRAHVPGWALLMQALWTALLALSGGYSDLLDYVVFAELMFYVLTVAAVFVLRAREPDRPRSYRVPAYPYLPACYIAAAVVLMIDLLVMKPRYTWAGLLIVLSGLPVYWFWSRRRSTSQA